MCSKISEGENVISMHKSDIVMHKLILRGG